jgi:hypothetical protein
VGWLTQQVGSSAYWYTVDIAAGTVTQNGTIALELGATRMQAIGYNVLDGLIYGTNDLGHVQRFGLDLNPQTLATGFPLYQTGDVDLQGQYWAARTAAR